MTSTVHPEPKPAPVPPSRTPEYNRDKVQRHRERMRAKKRAALESLAAGAEAEGAPKMARLARLVLEAEALAAEINAEEVSRLHGMPFGAEKIDAITSLDGAEMRLSLAKVPGFPL